MRAYGMRGFIAFGFGLFSMLAIGTPGPGMAQQPKAGGGLLRYIICPVINSVRTDLNREFIVASRGPWSLIGHNTERHDFAFAEARSGADASHSTSCDYIVLIEVPEPRDFFGLEWGKGRPVKIFRFTFNLKKVWAGPTLLKCEASLLEDQPGTLPADGGNKALHGMERVLRIASSRGIIAPQLELPTWWQHENVMPQVSCLE